MTVKDCVKKTQTRDWAVLDGLKLIDFVGFRNNNFKHKQKYVGKTASLNLYTN